jgi:hypothetical protein
VAHGWLLACEACGIALPYPPNAIAIITDTNLTIEEKKHFLFKLSGAKDLIRSETIGHKDLIKN